MEIMLKFHDDFESWLRDNRFSEPLIEVLSKNFGPEALLGLDKDDVFRVVKTTHPEDTHDFLAMKLWGLLNRIRSGILILEYPMSFFVFSFYLVFLLFSCVSTPAPAPASLGNSTNFFQ